MLLTGSGWGLLVKHVYFIAQIYKILVSGTRMGAVPFYPLAKAVGREQPVLVTYCGMIPQFRYPHKPRRPVWRTALNVPRAHSQQTLNTRY